MITHRLLPALALLASALALPGCLISSRSSTSTTGATLAPDDVRSIQVGVTTSEQLIRSFGEPTSRVDRPDGSATWKYCQTDHRHSSGAVFLIFGGSSSSTQTRCAVIDLRDNVVAAVRRE